MVKIFEVWIAKNGLRVNCLFFLRWTIPCTVHVRAQIKSKLYIFIWEGLLYSQVLPVILSLANLLSFGSELIWHSYTPLSLAVSSLKSIIWGKQHSYKKWATKKLQDSLILFIKCFVKVKVFFIIKTIVYRKIIFIHENFFFQKIY